VVELTADRAAALATRLAGEFYVDPVAAREAALERRSFNVIHLETGIEVDLFVRGDEPFDFEEFARHRAEALPFEGGRRVFVKSPEDILLRKLQWYESGGGVSDRQWGDILGVVRTQASRPDRAYLTRWAAVLGVEASLARAFGGA